MSYEFGDMGLLRVRVRCQASHLSEKLTPQDNPVAPVLGDMAIAAAARPQPQVLAGAVTVTCEWQLMWPNPMA